MKFPVELGERSYDVVVERGATRLLDAVLRERASRAQRAVVVTTDVVASQPWFDLSITTVPFDVVMVPDGERAKSPTELERLLVSFTESQLSRQDVVVAVGGGAVTDLAGFAAATYMRGVAVVHVPTSLVGQVDAAIGGKTAVNLPTGKNLMGAFHQPLAVLCDLDVLATLPEREMRNGYGEVAKCWLLDGRDTSGLASATLDELVALSVALKADVVSGDERESGRRALLNYGHTLAHALEAVSLAGQELDLRHGEAVAIGTAFAVRLAHALGRVSEHAVTTTDAVLAHFGLSVEMPTGLVDDDLLRAMGNDKKAQHDLTFVLPGVDGFDVVAGIDEGLVRNVLKDFKGAR